MTRMKKLTQWVPIAGCDDFLIRGKVFSQCSFSHLAKKAEQVIT